MAPDSKKIIIYTDGGSRGNPGPAALGVVVRYQGEQKEYGEYIGRTTNNVAEYSALIFALKKVKQLVGAKAAKNTEIEVRMDSELVVRQMLGRYRIQEAELQKLFMEIWNLRVELGDVLFVHVPREQNKDADRLVNEALDTQSRAQELF